MNNVTLIREGFWSRDTTFRIEERTAQRSRLIPLKGTTTVHTETGEVQLPSHQYHSNAMILKPTFSVDTADTVYQSDILLSFGEYDIVIIENMQRLAKWAPEIKAVKINEQWHPMVRNVKGLPLSGGSNMVSFLRRYMNKMVAINLTSTTSPKVYKVDWTHR